MKQLDLTPHFKPRFTFGGALIKPGTHPKTSRPLDSKFPIHLVLRAQKSAMRLPQHFGPVDGLVKTVVRRRAIRVYAYANVGNHLHLVIKLPSRRAWAAFIRELTGRIALRTGVRWLHRPFTRVVRGWRRAFRIAKDYVGLNRLEAERGLSRPEARRLLSLRSWFA